MTTATPAAFRGQYRPRGSCTWSTFTERASEPACWDELLTAPGIPAGADLRVVRVAAPGDKLERRPVQTECKP
jgi:hypothetical protein